VVAIHYRRHHEVADGILHGQRYSTRRSQVAIGRERDNDLVLPDAAVSRRHCRITQGNDGWRLEDLGSTHGTCINGLRVRSVTPVVAGERIEIGPFVLVLDPLDAMGGDHVDRAAALELALLESIANGEHGSRLVYADWLEERGDVVRAEFLRLLQAIIDAPIATPADKSALEAPTRRMRELVPAIDLAWRLRVSRLISR
jgi:uncharacterized protein (TIGR02996 family)